MPRQLTPSPRRLPCRRPAAFALAGAVLGLLAAGPALAQDVRIERSISLQQTFTTNGSLSGSDGKSDAITRVSPGVTVSGRTGRTSGTLDYRLDAVAYARDSDRSELRNFLAADGSTELVDNHVFLDAAASVSQQSISAFGQQSAGTGLASENTSEVSSFSLSPRARARLAGLVDFNAYANWTTTQSGESAVGDSTDWDASASLGAAHGIFGWNAAATRQSSDYDDGSRLLSDSVIGTVSVAPTPRLNLFVRGGRERADYGTGADVETTSTSGWGVDWRPTPRTQLSFSRDRRYYGDSHGFTLSHRLRRAVLSYTDSRGVSGESTEALGPLRQTYLRVYTVCMAAVNNAAYCTQITRAVLGFDPTQTLGFLNSAPSLQRTQALALAVNGLRNSFSLAATRTVNERLEDLAYVGGDLGLTPRVRQHGLTFGASHRLTSTASLSLGLSLLRTLDEPKLAGTDQRRVELGWSDAIGPRTTGSVSVRHVRFDSETSPYRESALIGSLNHRF